MTETDLETAYLTADAVLFGEHDDQLYALVIRRGWEPYLGSWALPGGYVDQGERPENAAHRELTEETGLSVGTLKPVCVYADPGRDPRGRYVTFAYTARLAHLPRPTASDGELDARWVLVDELLSAGTHLAFDHARILHDALRLVI